MTKSLARPAPALRCGTAAACGLGLRPLALGASGGDPPAPGLFLTAERRRFAPRPGRTHPLAGGAVRDDTADRFSGRGLPENSRGGGPRSEQLAGRVPPCGLWFQEGQGLHSRGVDCAIQTKYWTQVHMVSNPCCCPFERSSCGKRGAFSSRRPTAWKPGGRSQRDRLPVDPKGGAAVPCSGIHQSIHGVSMPEQPDRESGNQVEF